MAAEAVLLSLAGRGAEGIGLAPFPSSRAAAFSNITVACCFSIVAFPDNRSLVEIDATKAGTRNRSAS
jgi:hypothetical protein